MAFDIRKVFEGAYNRLLDRNPYKDFGKEDRCRAWHHCTDLVSFQLDEQTFALASHPQPEAALASGYLRQMAFFRQPQCWRRSGIHEDA